MTFLGLSSSFFIQALVDFVFVLGRAPALNWLGLGMLLVMIARIAFLALRSHLLAQLGMKIDAQTILGYHRHLLALPLSFFYSRRTGEIVSRLNDAIKIRVADPDHDTILRSFGDLVALLEAELGDDTTRASWVAGSAVTGSVNALLRRLRSAVRPLSVIVRGDLAYRGDRSITTSKAQVTVVDLHNLPERAQRFAGGVTLRGEFARKERQGTARPLMFVMLDELNKYAPREGDSPIKQLLLDIAERGRSLGVILIGAQQTASEVERRIVANCAIRVAGRLDAAEAERPEYGYLPPAQRQRATLAKPGTMFIAQPDIPVPLAVDFPFPAWATRPSEKGEWAGHDTGPTRPSDPFAAITAVDDEPPY